MQNDRVWTIRPTGKMIAIERLVCVAKLEKVISIDRKKEEIDRINWYPLSDGLVSLCIMVALKTLDILVWWCGIRDIRVALDWFFMVPWDASLSDSYTSDCWCYHCRTQSRGCCSMLNWMAYDFLFYNSALDLKSNGGMLIGFKYREIVSAIINRRMIF